ncbi:PadR family transcriptional regulator [Pseudoclavibacter sp. CFCC 13796]|uniref:PadR family transcriptional regulator n=1 Tax=Pseudoclavibacter sp. CFCC 13796 TaxID=2615179 RepID=UPI001300ED19|nr:PadR family transcriptional regulator [Pseudoclavibacter sp. CFCC 13796]KAB1661422.1 PadR family transcriptional regulator [Pseudoclavibacter sp. CFCC 13796]
MRHEHHNHHHHHEPGFSGPGFDGCGHDGGFGDRGHRRSHGRGPGAGGPGFGGPGFGGPGFGGPGFDPRGGFGHGGRGRARRGDTRLAILSLLNDEPANGYGIIKRIAERTDDSWRPSPGSIYPTLQQLTEEGLITASGENGAHELTAAGVKYVGEHAEQIAHIWDARPQRGEHGGLREAAHALMTVIGDFRHSTQQQRDAAIDELKRTRKALFRILASDDEAHGQAEEDTDTK